MKTLWIFKLNFLDPFKSSKCFLMQNRRIDINSVCLLSSSVQINSSSRFNDKIYSCFGKYLHCKDLSEVFRKIDSRSRENFVRIFVDMRGLKWRHPYLTQIPKAKECWRNFKLVLFGMKSSSNFCQFEYLLTIENKMFQTCSRAWNSFELCEAFSLCSPIEPQVVLRKCFSFRRAFLSVSQPKTRLKLKNLGMGMKTFRWSNRWDILLNAQCPSEFLTLYVPQTSTSISCTGSSNQQTKTIKWWVLEWRRE